MLITYIGESVSDLSVLACLSACALDIKGNFSCIKIPFTSVDIANWFMCIPRFLVSSLYPSRYPQ